MDSVLSKDVLSNGYAIGLGVLLTLSRILKNYHEPINRPRLPQL
jgi:hypothetical protein